MVGAASGTRTRNSVPKVLAPAMRAASSSDESMFRKAGVSSTILIGMVAVTRWSQMIPHQLKTSKGPSP